MLDHWGAWSIVGRGQALDVMVGSRARRACRFDVETTFQSDTQSQVLYYRARREAGFHAAMVLRLPSEFIFWVASSGVWRLSTLRRIFSVLVALNLF